MHVESAPIKTLLDTSANYSLVCYIMINAATESWAGLPNEVRTAVGLVSRSQTSNRDLDL